MLFPLFQTAMKRQQQQQEKRNYDALNNPTNIVPINYRQAMILHVERNPNSEPLPAILNESKTQYSTRMVFWIQHSTITAITDSTLNNKGD